MKKLEKLNLDYMGYKEPATEDEVMVEVLGLELAIIMAKQRIALLKQSIKVAEMAAKEK